MKDAVSSPTPGDVIARLLRCQPDGSAGWCVDEPGVHVIGRNPISGGLDGPPDTTTGLFLASSNLGEIFTDGVDVTMNYRTRPRRSVGRAGEDQPVVRRQLDSQLEVPGDPDRAQS